MGTVTIIDVARKAGVAPATVSHALNGKRPVNDATRRRIFQVIRELGYVPNHTASRLRSGKSGIIGCYASDITESFANLIVRGAECALSGNGSSLLFASGVELGTNIDRALEFFRAYNVDGILVCNHLTENALEAQRLVTANIPLVAVNSTIDGVTSIVPDNYAGGMQAAEHLVASGCHHPALIKGPAQREAVTMRSRGFLDRLKELGVAIPEALILEGDYSFQSGMQATQEILSSHPETDGIFCANDYVAAGAITAAQQMGRAVPDNLLVLGFDNREFSAFWPIPISTFTPPLEQMGQLGMQLLLGQIQNPDRPPRGEVTKMPAALIIRKSTCRPIV